MSFHATVVFRTYEAQDCYSALCFTFLIMSAVSISILIIKMMLLPEICLIMGNFSPSMFKFFLEVQRNRSFEHAFQFIPGIE